jgi:hypothetical protein
LRRKYVSLNEEAKRDECKEKKEKKNNFVYRYVFNYCSDYHYDFIYA